VKVFREEIDLADCPLQTYALFLFLPERGSMSLSQVTKIFRNMSQSSVSRNVDLLCGTSRLRKGETDKSGTGGWQLAERLDDDTDRRVKLLQLTPKGKALRERMHLNGMQIYRKILGVNDADT
jgi:DNA-binding MarR family transcriptional regulator